MLMVFLCYLLVAFLPLKATHFFFLSIGYALLIAKLSCNENSSSKSVTGG